MFDNASKWVLRRPPLHGLTPSAHDMARVYTVVAALEATVVPVAHAVTMLNDDSERQVRRWGGQWDLVRTENDPRDADVKRLHAALGDAPMVRAVLDWEMSTLVDPLSDAALMCVYRHPVFNMVHADSAWASSRIPQADELAQRYSVAAD